MKLKFVSDGTREGTKVVSENGEEIRGIQTVHYEGKADEVGVLYIKILDPEVDVKINDRLFGGVKFKVQANDPFHQKEKLVDLNDKNIPEISKIAIHVSMTGISVKLSSIDIKPVVDDPVLDKRYIQLWEENRKVPKKNIHIPNMSNSLEHYDDNPEIVKTLS